MKAEKRWAVLAVLGLASACQSGSITARCPEGTVTVCECPDGTAGVRTCQADGVWSPCDCLGDGTVRRDATIPEEAGLRDGGTVDAGDPCEGVTCSGHGTCQVTGGQAECICDPGYHPENLECVPDDPCEGVTCSGHGTCQVTGGQAECICDPGYHAQGLACVADNPTCPQTIADRVAVSQVSVAPDQVNTTAGGYFSRLTPPILAPTPSGAKVAWGDTSGNIHVTTLDDQNNKVGQDVTLPGNELRGFVAHTSGFAVLFQRGQDEMALVGFNSAGQQVFDVTIVGNVDHDQTGAKWIRREWGDYGRLAFHGGTYATYFGHVQNWGDRGIHQGDLLYYYDMTGNRTQVGWDWGCSHSLDVRIAYDGSRFGPVCLSDCYPEKAIMYNHRGAKIHDEPSGNCSGSSSAELGGLVALNGSLWLTFVSPEGRSSHDVALVSITNGQVGPIHWLTDTQAEETNAHLAVYGSNLLVAWQEGSNHFLAVVDTSGNFLVGPETVSGVSYGQQTDFVNYPNGDVGWSFGAGSTLTIVRVQYCE